MNNPPVPPDLDLRDFQYMPLDVVRLVDSDLSAIATGDEFKAAVLLWCKAWHQVPASSLPDDDRMLAHLAGFGRDVKSWLKVKTVALRGFERCSDGRLYHGVISEKANDAADAKRKQREKTANATAARKRKTGDRDGPRDEQRDDDRDGPRDEVQGKRREGKGIEGKGIEEESEKDARAQSDPEHWKVSQDLLKAEPGDLDDWEVDFLHSVKRKPTLTKPQRDSLKAIQDKLGAKGGPAHELPSVKRGTPAYDAWIEHYRKRGKAKFYEKQDAITVPTEFPPLENSTAGAPR